MLLLNLRQLTLNMCNTNSEFKIYTSSCKASWKNLWNRVKTVKVLLCCCWLESFTDLTLRMRLLGGCCSNKQGWNFTILKRLMHCEDILPSLSLSRHHFHFLWCNEWVTWKSSWWSASDTMGSSLSSSSIESLHNLSWEKLNARD